MRTGNQLHARVIDDHFLRGDLRKLFRNASEAVQGKTICELEDVRLVNAMDGLAPLSDGQFEREAEESQTRGFGHDLEALDDARHHLVFGGGVEILRHLANEGEIDVAEP